MALVETLKSWDSAVTELDQQHVVSALSYFKEIPEPSSKIIFNIACCYELIGRLTDAKNGFDDALSRDEHLVIAYFQRACVTFQLKKYKESAADFSKCHKSMMGKKFIDYSQLGLRYKLHECEPLFNAGVALIYAKDFVGSINYLLQAQKYKAELKHKCIDEVLHMVNGTFNNNINENSISAKLLQLPPDAVFRPPKSKVANLHSIKFLQEAKVVAAATDEDKFTGFVGRHRLEAGELVKAASAPNSPLAPRRGANKSPTAVAGEQGRIRKSKSPEPVRKKAAETNNISNVARSLPPKKALPKPPNKPLPVPNVANGKSSTPVLTKPLPRVPVPSIIIDKPSQPDVRPKQPKQITEELLKKQLGNMNLGQVRQLPQVPTVPNKNTRLNPQQRNTGSPPPRPPKAEPQPATTKKRKSNQLQRPPLNKAPPPLPKASAAGSTCDIDQNAFVDKPDPHLVTIDLICYSTVTIKVDRGTSLENLLDVAASISDFNLLPGTFNLWCSRPDNKQIHIQDEEMMQMLWMEKEEENYLPLWCYACQ